MTGGFTRNVLLVGALSTSFQWGGHELPAATPIIEVAHASTTSPVLETATTNPIQYYISFPRGWPGTRRWPVIVTIDGSSKDWLPFATQYASERDARNYPFIIVTPIVVTNSGAINRASPKYQYASSVWDLVDREGGCAFDLDGLQAILADVTRLYNAEPKYFLTSFSAGGHLGVATVLLHPEQLRAASLNAANYTGRCISDQEPAREIPNAPERVNLPVRFMDGTSDPTLEVFGAQQETAMALAKAHGYTKLKRMIVPSIGHEPMVPQTLGFFASLLSAQER